MEKVEWKHEPETLKLEPHLCPHWYHPGETFEDAYEYALIESTVKICKEEAAYENAIFLERLILMQCLVANGVQLEVL